MIRYVLSFFAVLLVTLTAGEAAMHFFAWVRPLPIAEAMKYATELRAEPTAEEPVPALQPHREAVLVNHSVRTNALGFRGPELAGEQPRLLVVGSSVAMGWGIAEDDTIAVQAARQLTERSGTPWVGVNGGIPNTNSTMHRAVLESRFDRVHPKAVALTYTSADIAPALKPSALGVFRHSLLAAYIYAWLSRAEFLLAHPRPLAEVHAHEFTEDSASWRASLEAITAMKNFCDERKVPFAVLLYPDTRDFTADGPAARIEDFVRTRLKAAGVATLDADALIREYAHHSRDLWVTPNDPHGNHRVSHALAKEWVQSLEEKWR